MSTSYNTISYLTLVDQILREAITRTYCRANAASNLLFDIWQEMVNDGQDNSDELYVN